MRWKIFKIQIDVIFSQCTTPGQVNGNAIKSNFQLIIAHYS